MAKSRIIEFAGKVKKFFQGKKQKKSISSTFTYDYQLLSVKGEAQREPWKDLVSEATGWFYFCNQVSLTIENKGNMPIDSDRCRDLMVLDLDIRGVPNTVELLEKSSSSPELVMGVKDGKFVLKHVRIGLNEPLKLVFLGYFAVHISEL